MPTTALFVASLCLPLFIAQDAPTSAVALVHAPPSGCLAYVEWRDPDQTVDVLSNHAVLKPLLTEFLRSARAENEGLESLAGLLERHFEGSAVDEIAALAGDGLALWVTLDENTKPVATLAIVAPDGASGAARAETLLDLLEDVAGAPGAFDVPTETIDDMRLWAIGDDLFVLARGANTYISQSRRTLDPLIAPKKNVRGRRALERLVAAHAARAAGLDAYIWVDIGAIAPFVALAGDDATEGPGKLLNDLLELPRNPQAQSLLGPGFCQIAGAQSWSFGLRASPTALNISIAADGLVESSVVMPTAAPKAPAATGGTNAAHALLYRDFATLLRERDELFDAQDLGDIAQNIAQFELLLGGLSLEEDVLPHLSPWVEVVSRTLTFEGAPRPELELPGIALIVQVVDAPNLGRQLEMAFQGFVAIQNIEGAQSGRPGLVMSLGRDGDQTWTAAHYLPPGADEPIDAKYNVAPAAALVGDRWILASHEELLLDLVDEARAASAGGSSVAQAFAEHLVIDGRTLAKLGSPQLEALTLAHSLNQGLTREKAREDMEGLVWLLERTDAAAHVRYEPSAVVIDIGLSFGPTGAPR